MQYQYNIIQYNTIQYDTIQYNNDIGDSRARFESICSFVTRQYRNCSWCNSWGHCTLTPAVHHGEPKARNSKWQYRNRDIIGKGMRKHELHPSYTTADILSIKESPGRDLALRSLGRLPNFSFVSGWTWTPATDGERCVCACQRAQLPAIFMRLQAQYDIGDSRARFESICSFVTRQYRNCSWCNSWGHCTLTPAVHHGEPTVRNSKKPCAIGNKEFAFKIRCQASLYSVQLSLEQSPRLRSILYSLTFHPDADNASLLIECWTHMCEDWWIVKCILWFMLSWHGWLHAATFFAHFDRTTLGASSKLAHKLIYQRMAFHDRESCTVEEAPAPSTLSIIARWLGVTTRLAS